jgi:hypothetical protein
VALFFWLLPNDVSGTWQVIVIFYLEITEKSTITEAISATMTVSGGDLAIENRLGVHVSLPYDSVS